MMVVLFVNLYKGGVSVKKESFQANIHVLDRPFAYQNIVQVMFEFVSI